MLQNELDMSFNYAPITYGDMTNGKEHPRKGRVSSLAAQSIKGEKLLSQTLQRLENKYSLFTIRVIDKEDIVPTISGGHMDILLRNGNGISIGDIISAQTFPQDYDFLSDSYCNIEYLCGMSVPPIMIKRIVTRLIESGVFDAENI